MKDDALLALLEETAERLSVKLSYDDLRKGVVTSPGAAFRLHGEERIILDKALKTAERVDVLTTVLAGFDTEGIFLQPEVRFRLEEARARARKDIDVMKTEEERRKEAEEIRMEEEARRAEERRREEERAAKESPTTQNEGHEPS